MPDANTGNQLPPGDEADKADVLNAEPIDASQLPPVTPPATKAPFQFNQQVNFYQQIPTSAWDRMSSADVLELSKTIIRQIDIADKRQFDYAMEQTRGEQSGKKRAMLWGSVIAIGGFAATAYLGTHGHEILALAIALPLTTVLAMVVGNRFLG